MATSQQLAETRQHYQDLHDNLQNARETCTDASLRPILRQRAEQVQSVLTSLDQADLLSRTADFEAVGKQIECVNQDLKKLKVEIEQIVQDAAYATKVVSGIDAALSAAAKLFA